MKILILSIKMPWPPKDGGAIATLNLGEGLARSGRVGAYQIAAASTPKSQTMTTAAIPIYF